MGKKIIVEKIKNSDGSYDEIHRKVDFDQIQNQLIFKLNPSDEKIELPIIKNNTDFFIIIPSNSIIRNGNLEVQINNSFDKFKVNIFIQNNLGESCSVIIFPFDYYCKMGDDILDMIWTKFQLEIVKINNLRYGFIHKIGAYEQI